MDKIIFFQDLLFKIKNPLAEIYKSLPIDIQEYIYIFIRDDVYKDIINDKKKFMHYELRNIIKPINKEHTVYINGAWEYLFHKKNWALSMEDAYNYFHYDNQIGMNILYYFRTSIFSRI